MFGPLGFQEILFILVIALLIFGPRRLPQVGRTIGKTLAEFRRASTDLKRSINAEMMEEELRQNDPREAIRETLAEVKSLGTGSPADAAKVESSRDGGAAGDPSDLSDLSDSSDPSEPRAAGAVARVTPAADAPDRDEAGSEG